MKKLFTALSLFFMLTLPVGLFAQVTLNVKMFIEGYYIMGTNGLMNNSGAGGCLYVNGISPNVTDVDTVHVSLMNANTYLKEDSTTGILQTDGSLNVSFNTATAGNSYYIKINHRNTLETWSAIPVTMSSTTSYDFTDLQMKAYGNIQKELSPGVWGFYSGDLNQDLAIDSLDYAIMLDAVSQILTGYVVEDITGDGVTESTDFAIMEGNTFLFPVSVNPLTSTIRFDEASNQIQIFPVPAYDHIQIKSEIKYTSFCLYTSDGKPVFSTLQSAFTDQIDLTGLRSGVYFLRFETDKGIAIKKLVVQSR